MDKKIIVPRKLQGFWELDPKQEIKFEQILTKIKKVFENHCFFPLDTPVMELSEILLAKSGGEIDKEIYRFTKGTTDACLRYDLTVPLARYVAMNENSLYFPFKRYQIGKVYRGERPQKGRLREFYQCDADIIGDEKLSFVNDAECVKLYVDIFKELNVPVQVEISNKKLLLGLVKNFGKEINFSDIAILLDKLDKISKNDVLSGLLKLDLSVEEAQALLKLCECKGDIGEIKKLKSLSDNSIFQKGIEELEEVNGYLESMGLNADEYVFNLSIIRGHNYYTGTVFEAYIVGKRNLGAVGGGGRYENLAEYFTNKSLPGVGMSIGVSRLFHLLEDENLLGSNDFPVCEIAFLPLGDNLNYCIKNCVYLQKNGVKADVMAEDKSFKSKLKEANRRSIPFIAIAGEDEVKQNVFSVKNMENGEQKLLSIDEILNLLR